MPGIRRGIGIGRRAPRGAGGGGGGLITYAWKAEDAPATMSGGTWPPYIGDLDLVGAAGVTKVADSALGSGIPAVRLSNQQLAEASGVLAALVQAPEGVTIGLRCASNDGVNFRFNVPLLYVYQLVNYGGHHLYWKTASNLGIGVELIRGGALQQHNNFTYGAAGWGSSLPGTNVPGSLVMTYQSVNAEDSAYFQHFANGVRTLNSTINLGPSGGSAAGQDENFDYAYFAGWNVDHNRIIVAAGVSDEIVQAVNDELVAA